MSIVVDSLMFIHTVMIKYNSIVSKKCIICVYKLHELPFSSDVTKPLHYEPKEKGECVETTEVLIINQILPVLFVIFLVLFDFVWWILSIQFFSFSVTNSLSHGLLWVQVLNL
jgi:hypothetical protein